VIPSNPEYDYSIDAIVTDPPYGKKYLDLYDQLAGHVIRILKEGGPLLVMTGQSYNICAGIRYILIYFNLRNGNNNASKIGVRRERQGEGKPWEV
jgi:tRNA G10  N-methylase Trm11